MHFRMQMKADWAQSDRIPREVGPEQQDSFAPSYTGSASPTSVSLVSLGPALVNTLTSLTGYGFIPNNQVRPS